MKTVEIYLKMKNPELYKFYVKLKDLGHFIMPILENKYGL